MFKNWTLKKHALFSLFFVLILFFTVPIVGTTMLILNVIFSLNEAGSIGIIGGADGPTAIFLANKLIRTCGYFCLIYMGLLLTYIPINKWVSKKQKE